MEKDGTGRRGAGQDGEGLDGVERDGMAYRGTERHGEGRVERDSTGQDGETERHGEGRDGMERDGTGWGDSSLGSRQVVPFPFIKFLSVPAGPTPFHLVSLRSIWSLFVSSGLSPFHLVSLRSSGPEAHQG